MNILSLPFNPLTVLAEIPDYKAGEALEILKNSSTIANELGESFQTLWDGIIFNTDSSFWIAVVSGALDFALIGLVIFAWNSFKTDNDNRQKIMLEGLIMVTILSILLGGNGAFTSKILAVTHGFDVRLNRALAKTQVLDLTIAQSLENISLSNASKDKVDALIDECTALQGDEKIKCLEKQIVEIEKVVAWAEANDPIANSPAAKYAKGVLSSIKTVIGLAVDGEPFKALATSINSSLFDSFGIMGVIKLIFAGVQLAFNFALEVASILHALLLPLVIGVMFTSIGAKYIETWIQGYIQIVSIKFLYTALIGLTAEAIVRSQTQFATGMPFLIFSSVLGPCVAFYMAKGGGANLAQKAASATQGAMSSAVKGGASLATGGAGKVGMMLGKGLMGSTTKGLARRTTKQARYS